MVNIFVCSKVDSLSNEEVTKLHLNDAYLSMMTVQGLLDSILEKYNLSSDRPYHLICYGRKLKGDKHISHYGIKSNTLVYLFANSLCHENVKEEDTSKEKKSKLDPNEIQKMLIVSRTALMDYEFRKMLEKLYDKDFRENLMQCIPSLREDPITLAVLQDPKLLTIMMDSHKIYTLLEKHPAILEVAAHLATAFHEEEMSRVQAGPSVPSYPLDLSDEEVMMGTVDTPPSDGQQVMSPTTVFPFGEFLERLINSRNSEAYNERVDMLRRSFEFTRRNPSNNSNNLLSPSLNMSNSTADMSQQLQQMHDLGISDVDLCLGALYATNGDVQAAVNLIFSDNFRQ